MKATQYPWARGQGSVGGIVYYLLPSPQSPYLPTATAYLPKDSNSYIFPHSLFLHPSLFPPLLRNGTKIDRELLLNRYLLMAP